MPKTHKPHAAAEHPWSHRLQTAFLILFLAVWLPDSFLLGWSTSLAGIIPLMVRLMLGVVVLALALLLMAKGHRAILDTDSPELVTSGVLAHVRHPLHLGTLLVYLAGILATLSLATLVLWFVIVIGYDRLASYEEQKLEEVFGQVYRDYKKRVPKWIPRP